MKEEKILDALNDVDDNFIDEAKPQAKKKGKIKYFKWIAVAACFVVLVCAAKPFYEFFTSPVILEEEEETTTTISNEEITEETQTEESTRLENATEIVLVPIDEEYWKNAKITEKFEVVEYNSKKYVYQFTEAEKSDVSEKIATVTVESTISLNGEAQTTTATLYKLKNIHSDCAVAVKFEESNDFFVYGNHSCRFTTLEEIVSKLNLKESMKISVSHYNGDKRGLIKYNSIDKSIIWKMLLDDTSLKVLENPKEIKNEELTVCFNIPEIYPSTGLAIYSIEITRNGYMAVHVLDNDYVFEIGKEKAENFIEYVTNNYEGRLYVYTTHPNSSQGLDIDGEGIPVTEVISNGYTP